jgi:co-chaperonin GroES (HSP10)
MKIPNNATSIDKYIIRVDSLHKKRYLGGEEIYVDNTFNPLQNAQTIATIIKEPLKKSKRNKNIDVGDQVLIHHFATQEAKPIEFDDENECNSFYFFLDVGMMYMSIKPDGSYKTVGPFCIITKKCDEEEITASGIYTGYTKRYEEGEGKVLVADDTFIDGGGKVGDTVMFAKGRDYDIEMPGGDVVYRVRTHSIYAIKNG